MCGVVAASSNAIITKQSQETFRENSREPHPTSHTGKGEMRLLYSKPMHKMLLIIERKTSRCAGTSHDD